MVSRDPLARTGRRITETSHRIGIRHSGRAGPGWSRPLPSRGCRFTLLSRAKSPVPLSDQTCWIASIASAAPPESVCIRLWLRWCGCPLSARRADSMPCAAANGKGSCRPDFTRFSDCIHGGALAAAGYACSGFGIPQFSMPFHPNSRPRRSSPRLRDRFFRRHESAGVSVLKKAPETQSRCVSSRN
jgi:hypothetical protein